MKKRIIPILVAILALAAGLYGAYYWQTHYLSGVSMVKIPVPKADIPPYTLLTADMFTLQEMPRALMDQGSYLVSTGEVDGEISVETLLAGLPVARRMAVPPGEFRLADPSQEVISLPVDAASTVGGQVHLGETVNIYSLQPAADQGDGATSKPEVVFVARVPVVAILSDNGAPLKAGNATSQPQPVKILVVAAPAETVRSILDAIAMTEHEGAILWITLATP